MSIHEWKHYLGGTTLTELETQASSQSVVDRTAYSALWTVESAGDLFHAVEDQFESWLRTKGSWDPSTETSGYHVGPDGQELLVVHRDGSDGRSLRLRLIESNNRGVWRTSLTVNESHHDSWVGLRVTSAEGIAAKVPRLAGFLLEALELRDGETWLSSTPRRVSGANIEQVAEEVTDPRRQGLYFIAGTDDSMPFDAFADRVERWTLDTRGMAQVVVLDPSATRAFGEAVGKSHEVLPWTVRTFDTDVDPAIASDGRRHRVLGTRRLAGSDAAVRSILGHAARKHAAQRPLPAGFSAVHRALVRMEDKLLVDTLLTPAASAQPELPSQVDDKATPSAAPAEPPPIAADQLDKTALDVEASTYLAEVELVKELLGIDVIDRDSLGQIVSHIEQYRATTEAVDRVTRQLEERRERIDELEFEREQMRDLADDQELDLADALAAQAKMADEIRWLRRKLAEQGDPDRGYGLVPAEETTRYPGDFSELADMLDDLESRGVVFTGDLDVVAGLSDQDHVGRVAGVAWDCLLALCDYVRARSDGDHEHGLRQYLECTPQGYRGVPRKKFAAKETATTMHAWGDQRSFVVPTTVDPAGHALMEAHFKLGLVGMVSPRMYYLDNYARDGKVYVGYIGAHLRNTQTN